MAPATPSLHPTVWISSMFFVRKWILLCLFVIATLTSPASSSRSKLSYSDHCNSVVPESTSNGVALDPNQFIDFYESYFTGGENIFFKDSRSPSSKFITFHTKNIHQTETKGILKVTANLKFRVIRRRGGNLTVFNRTRRERVSFQLEGFWSESTGKLCMIGRGETFSTEGKFLHLSVIVKLDNPRVSNISTILVTGMVESLDTTDSSNFFDPISMLAYPQKAYQYTLISKAENMFSGEIDKEKSLGLESGSRICSRLNALYGWFQLEYKGHCSNGHCSPFNVSKDLLPSFMSLGGIQCSDDGKLHLFLQFSNCRDRVYNVPFVPETMLVGEGVWDGKNNQLNIIACLLRKVTDSLLNTSVGDCTVGLSLRFPATLSIRMRSAIVGHIWSNRHRDESSYFERIKFWSVKDQMETFPGLKYEYTEVERLGKLCGKKDARKSKRRYPDGHSPDDMRLDFSVKNKKGNTSWGNLSPLSIGDKVYGDRVMVMDVAEEPLIDSSTVASTSELSAQSVPSLQVVTSNDSLLNVSYTLTLWGGILSYNMSHRVNIFTEGIYNVETGHLCMVGCRLLDSVSNKSAKALDYMDCQVHINIQFSPLNPQVGDSVKGTIKSTRKASDPLYFDPLELSSDGLYSTLAEESKWRMDLEMIISLISLTASCVFIGLQLFYVKRHQDVLPSMSVIMLVVLTLGHAIPLILNFEAFFSRDRNRQNVLSWNDGWLEVNEIVVRVTTMVAFVLHFRLLQLTWSARSSEGSRKGIWGSEKKALFLCLPLYLFGGLIIWIFNWKKYEALKRMTHFVVGSRGSIWEYLRSYAGLLVDGFLLPQILLNLFWYSADKALSPPFYVGTTVVRLLPHAYDAYRADKHIPQFNSSSIYANPDGDFYSTAWNVTIPCVGLLFAIVIYLQQRFGGACILPPRFRQSADYEKVPVVSS